MKLTKNQTEQATLTAMYRALDRQHPVTITYTKADGTVTLRTIEIREVKTTKAGAVILRAADRQSGELRTFRADRIVSYTLHRTCYLVTLPETDRPAHPVPAFHTPSALIAYEIGRDERGSRYQRAA